MRKSSVRRARATIRRIMKLGLDTELIILSSHNWWMCVCLHLVDAVESKESRVHLAVCHHPADLLTSEMQIQSLNRDDARGSSVLRPDLLLCVPSNIVAHAHIHYQSQVWPRTPD